ncbi:MAG: hypothetical protein KGQ37_07460 [Hyphomicrobiales bacterium]|nr:hypothetical protein [Hyphomicrobiales bacterium]
MGNLKSGLILGLGAVLAMSSLAHAGDLTRVGQCEMTRIKQIMGRITPRPDNSGTGIAYADGVMGFSYQFIAAIARSRAGDRVRLCLVSVPKNCPPGDNRGRFYSARNMRTGASWKLPDAEHMCGGA